eukprot:9000650-Prorocentrum_lima.AAC.1
MKQKEACEEQLQLKQSSVNHEHSVLKAHATRHEPQLLVVYKRKLNELNQQHAAREERLMEKL